MRPRLGIVVNLLGNFLICLWIPSSPLIAQTVPRDFALPLPLYAPNSAWNQSATGAAVLPQSDQQILRLYRVLLGDNSSLHPCGTVVQPFPYVFINYDDFSVPVSRTGSEQQSVLVRDYAGNPQLTNPSLPMAPDGTVSLPAPAGSIRPAGPQSREADGWLVLYDLQRFLEYDFWDATTARDAAGNSLGGGQVGTRVLEAGAIEFFDVRGPGSNRPTFASARATGPPLLAGLILPEDVEHGIIDHALAFAMPGLRNTNTTNPGEPFSADYFYPASTTEVGCYSTDPLALAAGQRIRLRSSLVDDAGNMIDEAQLAQVTRMFLRALRNYGAYLVENAGAFAFYAEDIHTAVLHLSDAEVNRLIGQPPSAALPPGQTKWQIVMGALSAQLAGIPVAFGPWQAGQDPRTATITTSNFEVVEPATVPSSPFQTIIPHTAFGGGYLTRLFITNLASTANAITVDRLTQSGVLVESTAATLTPASTVLMTPSQAERAGDLTVRSVVIGSQEPISASVLFDCCSSGTDVNTAVGVLGQATATSFGAPFVFQREVEPAQPLLVQGMAIANRGNSTNLVTIRLLDAMGTQVSSDTLSPIPALGQTAFTVSELPSAQAQLTARNSFLGALQITGTQPFAPVIVGNLGRRLFSLPIAPDAGTAWLAGGTPGTEWATTGTFAAIPEFARSLALDQTSGLPSASNLTLIPHFVIGGGYVTRVFVKNLAGSSNGLTMQFMNQNGTTASTETITLAAGQTIERTSGEENRSVTPVIRWIAIGSDQPISASALFDCCASGTALMSAVGVLAQTPGTSFLAPFLFQLETASQPVLVEGLGIANSSPSGNTVTVRLADQFGTELASDTLDPIPPLGQTAFTVSELPNIRRILQGRNDFLGLISVSGTQPFAPVIVGNLGGRLFSLPLTAHN